MYSWNSLTDDERFELANDRLCELHGSIAELYFNFLDLNKLLNSCPSPEDRSAYLFCGRLVCALHNEIMRTNCKIWDNASENGFGLPTISSMLNGLDVATDVCKTIDDARKSFKGECEYSKILSSIINSRNKMGHALFVTREESNGVSFDLVDTPMLVDFTNFTIGIVSSLADELICPNATRTILEARVIDDYDAGLSLNFA